MKRMARRIAALVMAVALLSTALLGTALAGHNYNALSGADILRRGSRGNAVKSLQRRLIELGYLNGSADGSYGAKTESAVWDFQRKNGITASGVATMFTLAAIYGDSCLYAWNNNMRPNYGSGSYTVQNGTAYTLGNTLSLTFDFVNYDPQKVKAICIYYWMADSRNNLVKTNGYEYYMQWYYDCNIPQNGRLNVTNTLYPKSSELNKAKMLLAIVGEICYEDDTVVVTMNTANKPYGNRSYILKSW